MAAVNACEPQVSTWVRLPTALGDLALELTGLGLKRLRWPAGGEPMVAEGTPFVSLQAFLAGQGPFPAHLPLDLGGQPPFHRAVYQALRDLGPGQTITYGQVAHRIGSPGAARAVGQAVKSNPIPILIPCHRVVAAQGPGGYSFPGGLALKFQLLELERGQEGLFSKVLLP